MLPKQLFCEAPNSCLCSLSSRLATHPKKRTGAIFESASDIPFDSPMKSTAERLKTDTGASIKYVPQYHSKDVKQHSNPAEVCRAFAMVPLNCTHKMTFAPSYLAETRLGGRAGPSFCTVYTRAKLMTAQCTALTIR